MISNIITIVTNFIIHTISSLGYPGVALLMAVQTMAIPIPSEIIVPFAGYLVFTGRFSLLGIAIIGAVGSCIGASVAYYIGYKGGRPLVSKYGKYILISEHDLKMVEEFFGRFGSVSAFFGQLLPIARSFIAFPAGVSKMPFWKFLIYTFIGSFIWSLVLAFFGMKLGENWETLREKLHGFDTAVIVFILLGVCFWIFRHMKLNQKSKIKN
jgi:membrane protein DedA with SNARE-associated domain